MPGWGTAVGWIFGQFKSRGERLRDGIDKLKKEQDELVKDGLMGNNIAKYNRNAVKLRKLEEAAKNKA